jgi:hypothetical protein
MRLMDVESRLERWGSRRVSYLLAVAGLSFCAGLLIANYTQVLPVLSASPLVDAGVKTWTTIAALLAPSSAIPVLLGLDAFKKFQSGMLRRIRTLPLLLRLVASVSSFAAAMVLVFFSAQQRSFSIPCLASSQIEVKFRNVVLPTIGCEQRIWVSPEVYNEPNRTVEIVVPEFRNICVPISDAIVRPPSRGDLVRDHGWFCSVRQMPDIPSDSRQLTVMKSGDHPCGASQEMTAVPVDEVSSNIALDPIGRSGVLLRRNGRELVLVECDQQEGFRLQASNLVDPTNFSIELAIEFGDTEPTELVTCATSARLCD